MDDETEAESNFHHGKSCSDEHDGGAVKESEASRKGIKFRLGESNSVESGSGGVSSHNESTSMNKDDEVMESTGKRPKRKIEIPSELASVMQIPKRGRPRKTYVFPVVLSSANSSQTSPVQSSNENSTVGVSSADGGDVNGGVNTAKVRHDNERTCHVCGKYYWKPSDLQRHLYKHTGERRFSCPICDQFFSCKRNMQYHQKAVHGLAIELSPGLDKKWKRRSYYFRAIEALKAAGGVQTLSNGSEINGEVDGEHSMTEAFSSETEEPAEQTTENQLSQEKVASGVDSSVTETEDDSSSCEVFISVEDAESSEIGEFKMDSMSEEILISRSKGVNTSSGVSTYVYKCHVCDKMYVSLEKLHVHFAEHLDSLKPDSTAVCEICGELFGTKYDLKMHMEDHPVADDECNFEPETMLSEEEYSGNSEGHDDMPSLLSPETLSDMAHASLALPVLEENTSSATYEIKDVDWNPGGLKCKICSKTFDRSFSFNRHLRSHTGVKKCYCPHCGKGFCEQRNLRHHIIRFHSDGSERHLLRRSRNRSRRKWQTPKKKAAETVEQQPEEQSQQPVKPAPVPQVPVQQLPLQQLSTQQLNLHHLPEQQQQQQQGLHLVMFQNPFIPQLKDFSRVLPSGTNESKKDENEGKVTTPNPVPVGGSSDVVDSVRQLLLLQANNGIKSEKVDCSYENSLSSCMLAGEKEDIVIKVEPPGYSEDDEEEEQPSPPPVDSTIIITGSPKLFTRKGRAKMSRRKQQDDVNVGVPVVEDVSPSTETADDGSLLNVKKGSHISKYTPRLPIIDKPERVKVIHPRRMEDGMLVFPCCYCDKVFTSSSDVHRHMNFHEDIRPYKCNQCNYFSRTTSQLKVHMMRHKGIKKYFCEPCNYYGVTQSDVNRHKKSQAHFARLAETEEVGTSYL